MTYFYSYAFLTLCCVGLIVILFKSKRKKNPVNVEEVLEDVNTWEEMWYWKCSCGYENTSMLNYDCSGKHIAKCDGCGKKSRIHTHP